MINLFHFELNHLRYGAYISFYFIYRCYVSLRSSVIYSYAFIVVGCCNFFSFLYFFKGKYVLWEKPYIPHVIIEYDLYPLSLVLPRLIGYTRDLINSSGYKSYSMTTYEISSIYLYCILIKINFKLKEILNN